CWPPRGSLSPWETPTLKCSGPPAETPTPMSTTGSRRPCPGSYCRTERPPRNNLVEREGGDECSSPQDSRVTTNFGLSKIRRRLLFRFSCLVAGTEQIRGNPPDRPSSQEP